MPDVINTINGLQQAIDIMRRIMPNQYWFDIETPCNDAIALLKAQEPRVMTLEEVIERKDSDAVWVEHMDGDMIVQPAVLLPSFLDTDKDCIHFASSWRTGGSYSRRSYGTKWRCWTSRPTDAQREAEPWQ